MSRLTFSDAAQLCLSSSDTSGDVSLIGYLAQHGFTRRDVSVGSVGEPSHVEALAINALVLPEASFVVLGQGSLTNGRSHSAELIAEYRAGGFDVRTQFADLTLPERWPQLLPAIAHTAVRMVGVDASLASSQRDFWTTLH